MWGLVLTHQEKRLILIAPFSEPVNGQIRHDVGAMSLDGGFSLGGKEIRIVIEALSRKNHPLVESLRLRFEVPLSEHGGLVSRLLQKLGKCLLRTIEIVPVVHKAVLVAVFTSNDHRPARTAN